MGTAARESAAGVASGMKKRAMLLLALLLMTSAAHADVMIQAQCNVVPAAAAHASFTNTGNSTGSGCASLQLRNRTTGATTSSAIVCSGRLEASSTGQPVAIAIVGPTVLQTCDGPGATTIGTFCDLTVQVSNVQSQETPSGTLFWFLIAVPSAAFDVLGRAAKG